MKKCNKVLAGILMGGLLAATSVGIAGCGNKTPQGDFNSISDVYGFAGMTTSLLASNQPAGSTMLSAQNNQNDEVGQKLKTAFTETLDKYMNVFDAVVGGTKPVDVTQQESDKPEFSHKLTVKVAALDGKENVCVMYFNETLKDGGNEVDDSDDEERETILQGEMYLNGSETPLALYGEKEIDPEDNEVELTFEARLDSENRVVFKQEREHKNGKLEEEYTFELVAGGHIVYEFSFELEKKANKVEVEYEQEVAGVKIGFEIEKQDDKIVVETADFFGLKLEIEVSVEKGLNTQRYVYSVPSLQLTFAGSDRPLAE